MVFINIEDNLQYLLGFFKLCTFNVWEKYLKIRVNLRRKKIFCLKQDLNNNSTEKHLRIFQFREQYLRRNNIENYCNKIANDFKMIYISVILPTNLLVSYIWDISERSCHQNFGQFYGEPFQVKSIWKHLRELQCIFLEIDLNNDIFPSKQARYPQLGKPAGFAF